MVKQNATLMEDHARACRRLTKMVATFSLDIYSPNLIEQSPFLKKMDPALQSNLLNGGKENVDFSKYSLSDLVLAVGSLQESLRNKLSFVEEECQYFKTKYSETARNYISLAEKFKQVMAVRGSEPLSNEITKQPHSADVRFDHMALA